MKALDALSVPLQGTTLIEASAGTGKTYTITTLYLRLLLEKRLTVKDILVVTFTNAATAELRDRLRRHLRRAIDAIDHDGASDDSSLTDFVTKRIAAGSAKQDRAQLLQAVHGFDEAAVFTIHGFCQRVLEQNAFESAVPFDAELITDQSSIVGDVVQDFWVRELHAADPAFIAKLGDEGVSPSRLERLALKAATHRYVEVLPNSVEDEAECAQALGEWREALAAAAAMWTTDHDEVLGLICDTGTMKQNQYPADRVSSSWKAEMQREMTVPAPGIVSRWPKFEKFTNAQLEKGTKKGQDRPAHRFFDACDRLAAADMRLSEAFGTSVLALKRSLVDDVRTELRRRKERARVRSFDDLLHYVVEALRGPGGEHLAHSIRQRFGTALIDEFQDTDPVQYEIFRRIYHGNDGTLFLIGDPKQAIYAFRGADVFAYLNARHDAGERTWTLDTNWRSDPHLIDAVNALYHGRQREFWLREIRFEATRPQPEAKNQLVSGSAYGSPLRLLFLTREAVRLTSKNLIRKDDARRAVTEAVAAEIARLLDSDTTIDGRPVQPADVAVLCRTNREASDMQSALRAGNVHSVLQSEASVFDSREASEVQRLLRAMAEPSDIPALKAALATSMLGVDAATLLRLESDESDWDRWVNRFSRWHRRWTENGFVAAFRQLLEEREVQARLLGLVGGERRMTNVLHLVELLHGASAELRLGPRALVHWLEEARSGNERGSVLGAEAAQIRLESDANAVKLLTIHRSKGLEYPIVFCPFLWEARLQKPDKNAATFFHDEEDGNRPKIDLGSPEHEGHLARAMEEELAENLRLLYVAVTRARHACVLVWGACNGAERSPLGYLLHQPDDVDSDSVRDACSDRITSAEDDELRQDLHRIADRSGGTIAVEDLRRDTYQRRSADNDEGAELYCRPTRRELGLNWRLSSFSGLTFAADVISQPGAEGIDHDTDVTIEEARPPSDGSGTTESVPLADFEPGARSGRFFHKLFEELDFQERNEAVLRDHVRKMLASYGLAGKDPTFWVERLCASIRDILQTPLVEGSPSWSLVDVPSTERLNEMEFVFPVCAASPAGDVCTAAPLASGPLLQAQHLAGVFTRHGSGDVAAYAERLQDLQFTALTGYLRGFVDLVFRHRDRWYIVDYKSNRLGAAPEDYAPSLLPRIMSQHHFYLQYHLYVVALHLHLQRLVPGYDYERDFGGVYYLFLRGMSPGYAPGNGIFHDRPDRALVEGLCAVLRTPGSAP